ncbi:TB2/DP1, HVA22 family domain-containing protein [Ditylenchus destructor]|uniref:TB2/DP1, HVA22 family domain-containing protein n=1 Tax=Ditylenchus destructor TaxID=166010 RepID=A0AAD4MZE9_9BILA|nr:TB2/DP1, HVA22 family domain-containing protein [Ditylenchus destructor]
MHEYGLLNVSCAFISIFLPCIETFRAIKSRNLDELEFVAKYWIVFGVWNSLEAAGNLFYLTRLVPAYSLLKLVAFSCIYLFGHDLSFEVIFVAYSIGRTLGQPLVISMRNPEIPTFRDLAQPISFSAWIGSG